MVQGAAKRIFLVDKCGWIHPERTRATVFELQNEEVLQKVLYSEQAVDPRSPGVWWNRTWMQTEKTLGTPAHPSSCINGRWKRLMPLVSFLPSPDKLIRGCSKKSMTNGLQGLRHGETFPKAKQIPKTPWTRKSPKSTSPKTAKWHFRTKHR